MARQGCPRHAAVHRTTCGVARARCPAAGCNEEGSRDHVWYHLHEQRHRGNVAHQSVGIARAQPGGRGLAPAGGAHAAHAQQHRHPFDEGPARRVLDPIRAAEVALYAAAKSGDHKRVASAMCDRADPNRGGEDGFTPLMTAAEAGHAEVVRLICRHPLTRINLTNT
jgi:hypothetical protein